MVFSYSQFVLKVFFLGSVGYALSLSLFFFLKILLELDFDPFTLKHLDGNTNFVLLFFMIGCQIKEFALVKIFLYCHLLCAQHFIDFVKRIYLMKLRVTTLDICGELG